MYIIERIKYLLWMIDENITDDTASELEGCLLNKLEIKFIIHIQPHFKKCVEWSRYNIIDLKWAKALKKSGKPKVGGFQRE